MILWYADSDDAWWYAERSDRTTVGENRAFETRIGGSPDEFAKRLIDHVRVTAENTTARLVAAFESNT